MIEITRKVRLRVPLGILFYVWFALGILFITKDWVSDISHPFVFWGGVFLWVIGVIFVLSLWDHFVYEAVVPIYQNRKTCTWESIGFFFVKRSLALFFIIFPLVFFLIVMGFLLERWALFSYLDRFTEGIIICIVVFFYWLFAIRLLFVDSFLLSEKNESVRTLLAAFIMSYRSYHWKHPVLREMVKKNIGYFLLQWGGISLLLLLPTSGVIFWIVLAIFIAIYQRLYSHLKAWEQKSRSNIAKRCLKRAISNL